MNFNREKHNRFIQYLDSTAEKNPLLWLPCVLIIALVLIAKHIAEYAKTAYLHRHTEKLAAEKPHLERKPFFFRAVAVTLTAALSLMIVPVNSFAAFGEEYAPTTEQGVFDDVSQAEEITEPEEITVPEEPSVPAEPSVPEETTYPEAENPVSDATDDLDASFFSYSNASVFAVDHSSHKKHDWSADDNYHWRFCETCGINIDRERHSFPLVSYIAPTATSFGKKIYKCICGLEKTESIPKTAETHTYQTAWDYDTNAHWHNCIQYPNCLVISNFGKHNLGSCQQYSVGSYYRDSYHYRECSTCSYKERAYHVWGDWQSDSSGHWRKCKECGQEDRREHNIPDEPKEWDYKYDGTSHWLECSFCGYQKNKTGHDINPDTWQHNNTHHRKGCTICTYATEEEAHKFYWDTDDQYHKELCEVCDITKNDGEHVWILENTDENEHWIRCRVCPETQEKTGHTPAEEWLTDETRHWHECTYVCVIDGKEYTCGNKKDIAEHTPDYDTWYGDEDSHWRQCSECSHEVEKVKHDYERHYDEVSHWDVCEDCGRKDHDNFHSYLEPSYTYDEDGVTPIKVYECVDCDHYYTVPVWHEHTFFDKLGYNELGHWYDCKYCGGKIDSTHHIYSEKVILEPTETKTGIKLYDCTLCDYSYEATIPELEHIHTFDTKWHKDKNDHWHECTSCGEKTDTAAHILDDGKITVQPTETSAGVKIYTCTVCDYSYEATIPKLEHIHTFDTEWHKDKNAHWHECTSCGEVTDTAAHISDGGKITVQPTETSVGVKTYTCTVCGYIIKTETIPALTPVQEPPAAVTGTSLRLPYITNDPKIRGWQDIAEYIKASPDEISIPITMNGEIELPKEIAECIIYRNVTLRINMSEELIWTVNGLDVLYPKTVNLYATKQSNRIPASVLDSIISEFKPKEYLLYHSGDFGFAAKVTLNVGKKYNNYYAVLYHYNTKTGQLEFVDENLVENSLVTFGLTHASYYAVAFNSIPIYDDISSGAGVFENSVPIETSAMPETNGVTIPAVKLPQIMKYSNKKRRYRILKKRRLDDLVFVF